MTTPMVFSNSSRTQRQCDLLSPLLFTLLEDILGRMLHRVTEGHQARFKWLMKWQHYRDFTSSLCYQYILLCEENPTQLLYLLCVLHFEVVSGLRVNLSESD